MRGDQPTHLQLAARIDALHSLSEDRGNAFAALGVKLDKTSEEIHALAIAVASLTTTIKAQTAVLQDIEKRTMALELTNAERKGERGLVSAIMSSKALAWLLALLATATLWITHTEAKLP